MACVIVDQATWDGMTLSACIHIGSGRQRVNYRLQGDCPTCPMDVFLPVSLLPAMKLGATLHLGGSVSPKLLSNVSTIQAIFSLWDADLFRKVPLEVSARPAGNPRSGAQVAALFTAGIDSFYTVLKHTDEISALVYIHGFDIPLHHAELRGRVAGALRQAAMELGKPLVEVETDLRAFSERYVPWEDYHGAALASVALLLSARFRKVYVPATLTYANLLPLGSHPLVDPLWSTEETELAHDGCEAGRMEKAASIADNEVARRWLRVCWKNRDGAYNCGRCEKCLRSMVTLRALGVLESFRTFPPLDLKAISRVGLPQNRYTWHQDLRMLEERGNDPTLARALRKALKDGRWKQTIRALRRGVRPLVRMVIPPAPGNDRTRRDDFLDQPSLLQLERFQSS